MNSPAEVLFQKVFPRENNRLRPMQMTFQNTMLNLPCNVMLQAPAGSGKSIGAFMAIIQHFNRTKRENVLWLCPSLSKCENRRGRYADSILTLFNVNCMVYDGSMALENNSSQGQVFFSTADLVNGLNAESFFARVYLVIVEGVEQVVDASRSLETVISRAKLLHDHDHGCNFRIVALSCAVANVHDFAEWLDSGHHKDSACESFYFGAENRVSLPVKVIFPEDLQNSGYALVNEIDDRNLVEKHITDYSNDCSFVMVVCITRKEARETALKLTSAFGRSESHLLTALANSVSHEEPDANELKECLRRGIAFNHAGLSQDIRESIAAHYRMGEILIVCTTCGIGNFEDFPADLVIIKVAKHVEYVARSCYLFHDYSDVEFLRIFRHTGKMFYSGALVVLSNRSDRQRFLRLADGTFNFKPTMDWQALLKFVVEQRRVGLLSPKLHAIAWTLTTFNGRNLLRQAGEPALKQMASAVVYD